MNPPDVLLERVGRLLGSQAVGWRKATGGYTIAERWSLDLADGRRIFAKLATTDDIARRIREEHRNMSAIDADFRCEIVAWQDGERPLLILEDLGHARWPPPWEPGDVERVIATLERVWDTPPPPHLASHEASRDMFTGWQSIAQDAQRFVGLGLASAHWLRASLPSLVEAERSVVLDGPDLIHHDVRSDNLCLLPGRVVLVDWNWACRGDRRFDLAGWACALRLEGGPLPDELVPGAGAHAAAVAGYFAANAGRPPPEAAPTVREFQARQLRIALPWVCRELGLTEPDLLWGQDAMGPLDDDLAAGRISEDEWYAGVEEVLADAYLSYAEPWRQSGKGGDETDWRWGRELVLDVVEDGDAVLDVGCANGYLMESFHRWGAERGLRVEPYGVDISWRLASLARTRLPHWADRIFEANVMRWTPPQRFEVVHTALDYMPPSRRREHIERVLDDFLSPGGRVVLCATRMPKGPDPAGELEAIGFRPDGIIESRHPVTGETRRTAWVRAPVP